MGRERGREMMEGGQRGKEGDGRNKGKRREVDKYNVQMEHTLMWLKKSKKRAYAVCTCT